jgi:hypothetical protein
MTLISNNNPVFLLIKAGLKKSKRSLLSSANSVDMPDVVLTQAGFKMDIQALNRFHQVTSWPRLHGTTIHPCYPHIIAFKLHMELMLHQDFPFAMLGLVHIENQITQLRPIVATDKLDLSCRFGKVHRHRKGWAFDIETNVLRAGELVWSSVSTNLFQIKLAEDKLEEFSSDQLQQVEKSSVELEHKENWTMGAELGRQYARVSNDYNLIHLHPLAAKLFGFKRHIAHGMWTKAQCLSALVTQGTESFECQIAFKKPIFLANNVRFLSATEQFKTEFAVTDLSQAIYHLKGHYNIKQSVD